MFSTKNLVVVIAVLVAFVSILTAVKFYTDSQQVQHEARIVDIRTTAVNTGRLALLKHFKCDSNDILEYSKKITKENVISEFFNNQQGTFEKFGLTNADAFGMFQESVKLALEECDLCKTDLIEEGKKIGTSFTDRIRGWFN